MTNTVIDQFAMFWPRVFTCIAHQRLVVQQQDEEHERGRQQRHGDHLNEDGDRVLQPCVLATSDTTPDERSITRYAT